MRFSPSHICKLLSGIVWILLFVFSLILNLELVGRKKQSSHLDRVNVLYEFKAGFAGISGS